uniref:Uncharacterized protein n=1 Tax=Nelumbo nucifera TaxID=4432 RepID=A0A822Z602_NELNU|nr:TPA_asm: hypothetical protein HUJ06_014815 [Nelumbo nucifera]DAD40502.1 TPA_asm: hypothetical protein HUJ06_014826 [Nelumbo nucifera]
MNQFLITIKTEWTSYMGLKLLFDRAVFVMSRASESETAPGSPRHRGKTALEEISN